MEAVIYTRVSSDPTGRGRSVTEQEIECRAVCAREGWSIATVLTDNDAGASRWSRKDRPAYQQLESTLKPGMVLVTWEASRAQRDLRAYVELRDLCADRSIAWSYSGRTYDLNRGDDRFTTGLDALLSEKEAEQTRERVLRAVRQNAVAGKPHGKVPFGYRIVRDPDTGEPLERVIDDAQAAIIQEAARRVLAGETMYSVAQDFYQRGIRAPRPNRKGELAKWTSSVLIRQIASPTYAGLRTYRGEVIGDATWPAIISRDDHEKLTAMFADPSRLSRSGDSRAKWLLSGIARCGVPGCGGVVRRINNRTKYGTYVCWTGFCVARTIAGVDQLVTEAIIDRMTAPDAEELLLASAEADTELVEALALGKKLRQRLDGFYDQAADGNLSPAALARIEAKLLPQIEAAKTATVRRHRSPLVAQLIGPDARQTWDGFTIEQQREVIASIMTVTINRTAKSRKFNPTSVAIDWL